MKKNTSFTSVKYAIGSCKGFSLALLMYFPSFLFGQVSGDYRTNAANATWSTASDWQTFNGSSWVTASSKPTSSNSVYIQAGHKVTLSSGEACNDLHLNVTVSEDRLALATFILNVNGKLRAYSGSANTIPGTASSSPSTYSSWITSSTGKINIVGNTRTLIASGEWGATNAGTASPNGFDLEINLNSGQTVTVNTSLKTRTISITQGTLTMAGNNRLAPDQGASGQGDLIIGVNGTVITDASGSGGNKAISRTSSTAGGTLTVNGTLRFTGASPAVDMTTINLNGTVEYTHTSAQNLVAAFTTYTNLNLSNSTKTTTAPISVSGTLATSATLSTTSPNTTTINGTFQLNAGGYALGSNFTYGSASNLVFNNTSSYGVANSDVFWPTTNGPTNVNILQGGLTLNSANRTVSGTFQTASGVTLVGSTLTLNGTAQINTGGFFNNSPTYGSSSTLVYNTGASFGNGSEWTSSSNTVGVGAPKNVTIQASGTTLTLSAHRSAVGNVTISTGATLALSSSGHNLYLYGDFTQNGTITSNNSTLVFSGAATQTINASSGTLSVNAINDQMTGGAALTFGNTNVTLTSSSTALTMANNTLIQLAGRTLTFSGGGSFTPGSGTVIGSNTNGANIVFSANTSISNCTNCLTLGAATTVQLNAGVNFGSSTTTINNACQINSGGYVDTNAPIYGSASTLTYNSGTNYGSGSEWKQNATSGAGVPQNVTINSGTTLNFGAQTGYRQANGHININSGSTLALSTGVGGDVKLGGNWTSSGTFTPNSRAVFFVGASSNQQIYKTGSGPETFDFLTIDKAAGEVQLAIDIACNQTLTLTNGKIRTNSNKVISAGTVTHTNGHVIGNLQKSIPTGATSRTFEVGDDFSYTPLSISFGNVTTTGNLTASVSQGAAPNSGALVALNNSKAINRYWTVTNSGTAFNNYSATFTFVSSDNVNGANVSALKLGKYDSPNWTYPTVSANTATTATATGMTSFSSFVLAECADVNVFSVTGTGTYCTGGTGLNIGLSGSETGVTYQLKDGATNIGSPVAGTGSALSFGLQTVAAVYTVTATNAANCTTTMGGSATIAITPRPTITLETVAAICTNSTSFAVPFSATTNNASHFSITTGSNALSGFSPISNQGISSNPLSIPIPNGSAVGTYDFNLSVRSIITGCVSDIYPFTVTINAPPTASIGGTTSLCQNATAPLITFTGANGVAPYTFTYTLNGGGNQTITTTSGNSVTLAQATNAAGTFVYALVSVADANCSQSQSGMATVTVNATTIIGTQPATTQTVCQSATPTDISLTATGTNLTYQWYSSVSNTNSGGTLINGSISNTYTPITTIASTTYYYCVVTGTCGTVASSTSEVIVTPTATPSVSIAVTGGSNPSCAGPNSITFTATPTLGGAPPQYQWKRNGANAMRLPNPNPAIFTPMTPLQDGDLITVVMTSNAACADPTTVISSPITIVINPTPTITLGTVAAICEGATSFAIPYSATSNGANTFSLTNAPSGPAALSGFTNISNQTLTSTPLSISIPNGSAGGTYGFNLSVRNSTTGCVSGVYPVSMTINSPSSTPTATVTQPTCTTATGAISVTSSTSGLNFSIDGSDYTNTSGIFSSVANNSIYGLTARNAAMCISAPLNVTVNAQPATPNTPTATVTQPTCTTPTGTITVSSSTSGLNFSIDGSDYSNTTGIFSGVAPNASYNLTARNAAMCTSAPLNVPINAVPSNPTITGILATSIGSTTQLAGSGTPAMSNPWQSASTGVATVNGSGLVTGVSTSSTTITYTDGNGCSTTATVNVNASLWDAYAVVGNTYYDLLTATGNPDFQGGNLGTFVQGESLLFKGGEIKTNNLGTSNICSGKIWYTVYEASGNIGAFNSVTLSNLLCASGQGCSGNYGLSGAGDKVISGTDGTANILQGLAVGNYKIAVYVSATGSNINPLGCEVDPLIVRDNGGNYWIADFTVAPCVPPSITSQSTNAVELCQNASATTLSVNATGSNLTYQWYSNTNNSNSGGTPDLFGSTSSYILFPTVGTVYYYCVVSGTCTPSVSSAVSGAIVVNPTSVGGTLSSNATVCSGTNSTALTLTGNTGSVTKWQSSTDNFATTPTDITNATTSLTSTNLTTTTYYRAVVESGACPQVYSSVVMITVTPLVIPSVSIAVSSGTNPTCSGSSVTFTATSTNGGTNPTYQWKKDGNDVGTVGSNTYIDAGTVGGVITCVMTVGSVICTNASTATSNSITLSIMPTVAAGALKFDGSNDHVNIGGNFDKQVFSIEMWLKPGASQVQYADIIDNNHQANINWVCQSQGGNTYLFGANGGFVTFTLTADTWQHVALVKEDKMVRVYVNGTLIQSAYHPNAIDYNGAQTLKLGAWGGGGRNWNGEMDEVRIWERVLCADEINNHISCELSGTQTGLWAYYKFNQGVIACNNTALTTLTDETGNHNGTLNGFDLTGTNSNFTAGQVSGACSTVGSSTLTTYYRDADGDGLGDPSVVAHSCSLPAGFVTNNTDCNDNIPINAGSTIAGSGTVCSGNNSGNLTLSNATSVSEWQSSTTSDFSSNITSIANTSNGLSFLNLSVTTYYRAVITSGACVAATSSIATVTVTPTPSTPSVSTTTPTTFCIGGSVTLTSDATTGNQWYKDGSAISGATNVTYNATTSGVYTVVVTANSCSSPPSNAVTVTVNTIPTASNINANSTTAFCAGGSVTLTSSVATGNQWYKEGILISGATAQTYSATAAGNYTVVVTTNGCPSELSNSITVVVYPKPSAPTVASIAHPYCLSSGGTTLGDVTLTTVSGETYNIDGSTFQMVSQFLSLSPATYAIRARNADGCISDPTSVIINPRPTLPALQTVALDNGSAYCAGGTGVQLRLGGSETGVNYQIKMGGSDIGLPIAGTGNALPLGLQTAAGTYVVYGVKTDGCTSIMSQTPTLSIIPLPTAYTVTGGGAYCTGSAGVVVGLSNSQMNVVSYQLKKDGVNVGSPVTGTGNAFSFGLQMAEGVYTVEARTTFGCVSTMSGSATIIIRPLPLAPNTTTVQPSCATPTGTITVTSSSTVYSFDNGTSYSPNPTSSALNAGTYNVVVKNIWNCVSPATSVTLGNQPLTPTITLGSVGDICTAATSFSLPYSATTGSPTQFSITAGTRALSSFIPISNATLAASPLSINVPSGSAAGTYDFDLTVTNAATCVSSTVPFTVTFGSTTANGGTVSGSTAVCAGSNSGSLSVSGYSGSISKWQSSTVSDFSSAVTDISNTSSNQGFTNLSVTTYYRAVIGDGSCGTANSTVATITVNPLPTPSIVGLSSAYCKSAAPVTLLGNPTGGTFTIDGGDATILDPSVLAIALHTIVYTYTDANTCSATATQSVSINATATIVTSPQSVTRCPSANATFTASATGSTLSYQWQVSTNSGGTWTDISGQTATTLTLSSVTLAMNAQQYRLKVNENSTCPVYSAAAVLTVANPSTPLSITVDAGDLIICSGGVRNVTALPTGGTMPYATYVWSEATGGTFTPSSNQTANVNYTPPTTTGGKNVRVMVTDANGCVASSNSFTNLSVYGTPILTVSPTPQTVCSGSSSATITTTNTNTTIGGSNITWSIQSSNSNVTIGTFTLTAAVTNGASQTAVTLPATTFTNTQTTVQTTNITFTARTLEGCVNTAVAAVSVGELLSANAGLDIKQSGATFTLNAISPAAGTGRWSVVSPNTFAASNISSLTNRNATVANVPSNVAVTLRWTVTQGSCLPVFDDVVLTRTEVELDLKALLAGALNTTTFVMNDGLRGVIPTSSSLAYAGTNETVSSNVLANTNAQTAVVDWVLIELRSNPSTIVASKAALILRNGDIVSTDGTSNVTMNVLEGSYYIVVLHRNHLGVMTAAPVAFSLPNGMSTMADFSHASTATYGTNAQKTYNAGAVRAMYAGDASGNGVVLYNGSGSDRSAIQLRLGATLPSTTTAVKSGYYREDINMNGQVKLNGADNDRILILNMIGGSSTSTNSVTQQF